MYKLFATLLLTISLNLVSYAQQPTLYVNNKDSNQVVLNSLNVAVKVVANIAITTITMEYCNLANRVLEGELTFPLPEGVTVCRYAIDVNGKLREAVPVEKIKAQIAFENTIKRKVDPGLLEKVEGNNFKTRIYPLPANGCRTIVLAYQQALVANNTNALSYNLPLQFRKAIPMFSCTIQVYSNNQPEVGKACGTALAFSKSENVYNATVTERDFAPNGSYQINIPKLATGQDVVMQKVGRDYYFLANQMPLVKKNETKQATQIEIIWDNSFSGINRDHAKEYAFIKAYAKKIGNGNFQLSTIGYTYTNKNNYAILNGNCDNLITDLQQTVYDGATNYSLINLSSTAQEHLLFTDGINTYGDFLQMHLPNNKNKIHAITAAPTSNYNNLNYIANHTGGQMINLNTYTIDNAINSITLQQLQLLNVLTNTTNSEIYPSYGTVKTNMVITGKTTEPLTSITLQYGYNGTVTYSETINLDYASQKITEVDLDKIWAQQKINQLEEQYDVFKTTIQNLGKQYGLVTRNTSLIILDNVADYAKYEITPPTELKAAYDSIIAQKALQQKEALATSLEKAIDLYSTLQAWWATDYTPTIKGQVINEQNKPIENATIKVGSTTIITDQSGYWKIESPSTQSTTATITKKGYLPTTLTIKPYEQYTTELKLVEKPELKTNRQKVSAKKIEMVKYTPPLVVADSVRVNGTILYGSVAGVTITTTNGVSQTSADKLEDRAVTTAVPYLSNTKAGEEMLLESKVRGYVGSTSNVVIRGATNITANNNLEEVVVVGYSNKRKADTHQWSTKYTPTTNNAAIEIKQLESNKAFIKTLKALPITEQYAKYIELRKMYLYTPSFYTEVATLFFAEGDKKNGLLILSTLADLNLADHELYKMLGYQLKQQGEYQEAKNVFKKVLYLRPQEPQSYRDYGLALADAGMHQNALDTLYTALTQTYNTERDDDYEGIEEIITTEINNLISQHTNLNTTKVATALLAPIPVDVRVVLNWNMNDADMDLWVTDPRNEKCYYSNNHTKIGGRISNDFTNGYGPEQFMLRHAMAGTYKVQLDYFGDNLQKIAGGTSVMAEIYTNYGKPNQVRKIIALQLDKEGDHTVLVGEFKF